MYTDGVTEAVAPDEHMYGVEQLLETINHASVTSLDGHKEVRDLPAVNMVDAIEDSVGAFTKDAPLSDDLTLVVIKREK